jgi:hypothetical protein
MPSDEIEANQASSSRSANRSSRSEALRKSIVDWCKDLPRLVVPALPHPQAREARCAPQFPHQRALSAGQSVRFVPVGDKVQRSKMLLFDDLVGTR